MPQSKIAEFAEVLGTTPTALLGLVDESAGFKSDLIAKVVIRMRSDEEFARAVNRLYVMDKDKLVKVSEVLGIM